MPERSYTVLFGHTYRWVVADPHCPHPYRLSLLRVPDEDAASLPPVTVYPPLTPSPCAEWNLGYMASKLAEGAAREAEEASP